MSSQQSDLERKAKDTGKEIQSGAQHAADKAQDVGNKAQDKASSTLHQAENKADKAAKDAKKEANKGSKGGNDLSKKDKENLKKVGVAVAVGAALIFGGVKVYRSQNKEEVNKGKVEDKAHGIAGWFGKKADQGNSKLDGKDGKEKAENVADKVVSSVKGAAETTKQGLDDAGNKISGSTKGARDKVSEEKSGNLFDKIGGWFEDRKDDASHAAGSAKQQVKDAGKKAKK